MKEQAGNNRNVTLSVCFFSYEITPYEEIKNVQLAGFFDFRYGKYHYGNDAPGMP